MTRKPASRTRPRLHPRSGHGPGPRALRRALADRRGAVTVDWLVLTAGIVVLILGIVDALGAEYAQIWDDMFTWVYDQTPLDLPAE